MASPSASSMAPEFPKGSYDVFLSFAGKDTRKTFVDHLYAALDRSGICTFKDDVRLSKGKSINQELLKSIEESRFSIVVFSKEYASSSWCLDELAHIIKCKKAIVGYDVFPVFYGVEPSEVRKQKGEFGDRFAENDDGNVEVWREALVEASSLSGWDLKNYANGHEAECVKDIVRTISSRLDQMTSTADKKLIGVECRIAAVMQSLGIGDGGFRMVGIRGMGGSGKTTLARAIFDELSGYFVGASFIENVREVSQESGLKSLQEKLLQDVLWDKDLKVDSVHYGEKMIKRRLCRSPVLVVLDDVDHVNQLQALAGSHEWFGDGSRIIVTTRDEQVLVAHGVRKEDIHGVALLNDEEAIQLFSVYAFGTDTPPNDYEEPSCHVIRYAAGLPLTLKVLGAFLRGRDMDLWESALNKLKQIPESETLEVLKISYDGLEDICKEAFLHIACFFRGWRKELVIRILDSCEFESRIILKVLEQKSLISMKQQVEMYIEVHDLIQEMGRNMVRQKYPDDPEKHSRLWRYEDILDVLTENTGTEEIKAIVLHSFPYESLDLQCMNADAFVNMKKLRLLHIDHNLDHFQGPSSLPNELHWLIWEGFPLESLPNNFRAKKLVSLTLCKSNIIQLWTGNKVLDKLKYLDLSQSMKLVTTPDFSKMPNLTNVKLNNCSNLVEVHPSIGVHKTLVCLEIMHCKNLELFPNSIQMEKLEKLVMAGCSKLQNFPEIKGNMDRLSELNLAENSMEELPPSIGNLPKLSRLNLGRCCNLKSLPDTMGKLQCLEIICLPYCFRLGELPKILGSIGCLKCIDVSFCGCLNKKIKILPKDVIGKFYHQPNKSIKWALNVAHKLGNITLFKEPKWRL